MEIGVYTFADTAPDPRDGGRGEPRAPAARPDRGDRAGRPGRARRLRRRRAPPAGLRRLGAGRRARGGRRAHEADPAHQRGDGAQLRRPGARLPGLRDRSTCCPGGRAEIMAGRGSFIESFPLFGYDLDDYDELFAEKLELLLRLRDAERVTWSGAPPRAARRPRRLPAAGPGPAAGVDRGRRHPEVGRPGRRPRPAAGARDHRRACPSGSPRSSELYRDAAREAGHDPRRSPWASTRTGTSPTRRRRAADESYPPYAADDEPHRARAGLAADDPRAVRRHRASRAARLRGEPRRR